MIARRVLVTRPEPGATATAQRLRAEGFDPAVLPLTRIEPLEVRKIPDLTGFDVVAVTSGNALRHAGAAILAGLSGKRCYAVGKNTQAEAGRAGLAVTPSAPGTALELAGQIVAAEARGARILYLCGRVRRPDFTEHLAAKGLEVTEIETYDARPASYTGDQVSSLLAWNPPRAALVYSFAGARRLDRLVFQTTLKAAFQGMLFVCLSERVGDGLEHVDRGRKRIAAEPSEEAMIALVRQEC